ncbi:MAG: hypothetical protein KDK45_25685, partial [Leptospiraceae bacterium]|nr:hypothetical protein [Leptospiraceae bacterium]
DGSGTGSSIQIDPTDLQKPMSAYYTEDTVDKNGVFHKKGEATTVNYSMDTFLYHELSHVILNSEGTSKGDVDNHTFFRKDSNGNYGDPVTLEEVKIENTQEMLYVKNTIIVDGKEIVTYQPATESQLNMTLSIPTVCDYLKSRGVKTCRLTY